MIWTVDLASRCSATWRRRRPCTAATTLARPWPTCGKGRRTTSTSTSPPGKFLLPNRRAEKDLLNQNHIVQKFLSELGVTAVNKIYSVFVFSAALPPRSPKGHIPNI